jgi:hypothetical protein
VATAIAEDEVWEFPTSLLVGSADDPFLVAVGCFAPDRLARLRVLAEQLDGTRLLPLDYAAVERATRQLAARLADRFGPDDVRGWHYVPVPRGGLIVLGLLAYILDLPPTALSDGAPTGTPLVVVDDCALSGRRFRSVLAGRDEPHVVFAHLYSHPALRAAIEAAEARVVACVAGEDLTDSAPELHGDGYGEYSTAWRGRIPDAYWIGRTEHLGFPWSEPDYTVWNATTGVAERGWRLIPSERCLAHHRHPGSGVAVQRQPGCPGPIRPAPGVLFGTWSAETVLVDAREERTVLLDPVAGDMWSALVATGTVAGALDLLAGTYDVDHDVLGRDLAALVERTRQLGFLTVP